MWPFTKKTKKKETVYRRIRLKRLFFYINKERRNI